jgi:hypothetical protein
MQLFAEKKRRTDVKLKFLLFLTIALSGLTAQAVLPVLEVIAEKTVKVGFAPAEHRGTFRLQILSSGAVLRVDNKDVVRVVARLTPEQIERLQESIDRIVGNELRMPDRPGCLDAPSKTITVTKSSGEKEKIWQNLSCQEYVSNSYLANAIARAINHLDRALQAIETMEQVKN